MTGTKRSSRGWLSDSRFSAVFLLLAVGAAGALTERSTANQALAAESGGCFVVQHYYFPAEGMEDDILAVRKVGNEVRLKLGLAASNLYVLESSLSGHPAAGPMKPGNASYLMSESIFADEAQAAEADEILVASEDYLAVRTRMSKLLAHFEMSKRRLVGNGCEAGARG